MGKPWFGVQNLLWQGGVTLSARTAHARFPVSDLAVPGVKWHRSQGYALVLNGTDEYAVATNHTDITPTGDVTFEIASFHASTSSGTGIWVRKRVGDSGFEIRQLNQNNVRLFLGDGAQTLDCWTTGDGFPADAFGRMKIVFKTATPEVVFYFDDGSGMAEAARIDNSSPVGGVINSGVVPSSLGAAAIDLYVGRHTASSNYFEGKMALVGLKKAAEEHGGYLDPETCGGYWPMAGLSGGVILDISGNGHDLTVSGIVDPDNFEDNTAFQWVAAAFSASQSPAVLVIDRRHNLSTGAVVRVLSGDKFGSYTVVDSVTATAGEPVVLALTGSDADWWLEINDENNADGYIELPAVWLGSTDALTRSYLRQHEHGDVGLGQIDLTPAGNVSGWLTADEMETKRLRFLLGAADQAVLSSVFAEARLARPVLWSPDGTNAGARLVNVMDALGHMNQHVGNNRSYVDAWLQEVGGGLGS